MGGSNCLFIIFSMVYYGFIGYSLLDDCGLFLLLVYYIYYGIIGLYVLQFNGYIGGIEYGLLQYNFIVVQFIVWYYDGIVLLIILWGIILWCLFIVVCLIVLYYVCLYCGVQVGGIGCIWFMVGEQSIY